MVISKFKLTHVLNGGRSVTMYIVPSETSRCIISLFFGIKNRVGSCEYIVYARLIIIDVYVYTKYFCGGGG